MRDRNFSFEDVLREVGRSRDKDVQAQIDRLKTVERQAIELTRLLKDRSFLSVSELHRLLAKQRLPETDLLLVAAFLAGYYSAETYDSIYDTELYGRMGSMDGKDIHAKASLTALLTMMRDKRITKLEDRRVTPQQPSKVEATHE
jgi:hypothetical protein